MANPAPIKVLLIDDDEDDYIITADLLNDVKQANFVLDWVSAYESGLQVISQNRHDVYLIDYRLGPRNGLELLRQAIAMGCKAPLILLTGQDDMEVDVEAMQAGAMDYLVKGQTNAAIIERSIRYAIKQKKAEEALRESEERLRHSQKMEAVGRLAGGVAHDFNNLLTVINGYSELLLRVLPKNNPLLNYASEISKAGERAAALTNQLLTFSRKEKNKPQIVLLNDVISNMQTMLKHLLGENCSLVFDLADGLGQITADPNQMEQVIMNLVVNARDAMPEGGEIIVKTQNLNLETEYQGRLIDLMPGQYVKLSVSDTGYGIDSETLEHIFEPFFTTKKEGKGTGLGLATVFGIVQRSDGNIDVSSWPKQGTTFDIFFPYTEQTIKPEFASVPSQIIHKGTETILLVEDEDPVRELTRQILIKNGYDVLEASNAEQALQVYNTRQNQIHLLLTDVIMPGELNGPRLGEKLLTIQPELKILYMSGYSDETITARGLLKPGVKFLQKPFTPQLLAQTIRETLDV